jgi:hypothetical protein
VRRKNLKYKSDTGRKAVQPKTSSQKTEAEQKQKLGFIQFSFLEGGGKKFYF